MIPSLGSDIFVFELIRKLALFIIPGEGENIGILLTQEIGKFGMMNLQSISKSLTRIPSQITGILPANLFDINCEQVIRKMLKIMGLLKDRV